MLLNATIIILIINLLEALLTLLTACYHARMLRKTTDDVADSVRLQQCLSLNQLHAIEEIDDFQTVNEFEECFDDSVNEFTPKKTQIRK